MEFFGIHYCIFRNTVSCKTFGSERSPREMLIPYLCFSFWHGSGTGADSCDSHRGCGRIHSSRHSYSLLLNHWQVTELYQNISRICGEPFFLYTMCSRAFKLKELYLGKKISQGRFHSWQVHLSVATGPRTWKPLKTWEKHFENSEWEKPIQ